MATDEFFWNRPWPTERQLGMSTSERDELLRRLNITRPELEEVVDFDEIWEEDSQGYPKVTSATIGDNTIREYVQNVDEWDIDQGKRMSEEGGIHSIGVDELERYGSVAGELADFYHAAFHDNPEVVGPCASDKHREPFIKTLLETPDFNVLHQSTQWNHVESKLAAKEFAHQYHKYRRKKEDEEDAKQNHPGLARKGAKGKPGGLDMDAVKAAQQAIENAQKEVDAVQEFVKSMGGDGSASGGSTDSKKMLEMYERIKNNKRMRDILEKTGKYRRSAQSKQRFKTSHGYDDMIGVEQSGDIARLLPLELAKLGHPLLKLDAMRRLVERQSMCREYQSKEPKGRGPIVFCVDESGSMMGDKIAEAKAFALAMAWIALHQRRACVLIAFHHGSQKRVLELIPGKWKPDELMQWLDAFFNGGGTDPHVPLVDVPAMWNERQDVSSGIMKTVGGICKFPGKADMILVTDGLMHVKDGIANNFNEWKEKNTVNLTTLIIGEKQAGDLARVSDEVFLVSGLDVNNEAVQKCLSI